MPKPATLVAWADRPTLTPLPKLAIQRILGEKAMVQHAILEAGFTMPQHAHDAEQLVVCLSGKTIFGVNGEGTKDYAEITVTAGQVLVLPSNCPHNARAIERTEIVDVFSQAMEATGVDQRKG